MVAPFSAGPTVYVDILPDASKFGGALKRDMMAHTSGLKRQSEQLSKSFTTSFTSIGKSIQSATSHLGIFGKTNSRVAESTIQAQRGVERATEQRERASIELAQAEQRLAQVQLRASSSAQELALAQLRVRAASLTAASASSRYDESIKRLGRSSDDTKRSFSNLVPSIGNANASLSLASRSAGMFGGAMNLIKWPALIQGANLAAAALSSLSAAAVGAIASLAPLAGLVATIPAGIAAVGTAVGTAALGFFGVGDALTAMGQQATAVIPAVGGAGGAAEDAGRRAAEAGRAVVAAQRGVADANRAVQDSERSLADAQRQVQYAQESLTDAREDARQTLQDLNDEVQGGALSEEQAKLRVLQARQRLREVQRDETATRLEVRQAILDVRQAEFDLSETREDNRESQQALNEAERAGIAGSEQVIEARRGVADANRGVEDAERALADAHRGVEDAQRAVAEAQRGVTEALQAGSGATTAASTEATALAEAMAALSPAGRDFVEVLFNMKPKLDELRATAQEGLLPGLGRAIQTLGRELFPLLNRAVGKTANTMGDLAEEGAALVTSGPWKRDFATLLSGNSRLLTNMGHIAFDLADAFRHIAIAGQPLAFWLGRVAEKGAQAIADFFEKARRSGDMADFFDDTKEAAKRLFSILGNLGTILVDVLEAGQPLGRWLLRQFDELTEGWADFTSSMEGQNALKKWFNSAKPVLRELGKLIGDIAKLFGEMATRGGLPRLIRQIRTRLLPVFADILRTSTGKLIPALVELTRQFGKLFKIFGTEHGFVLRFIDSLTTVLRVVTKLLDTAPVLKSMVAGLGSLMGIVAAVKLAGFLTGFGAVKKLLGEVGGAAAQADKKVGLFSRGLTAMGAKMGIGGGIAGLGGLVAGAAGFIGVVALAMNQLKNVAQSTEEIFAKQGRTTRAGSEAFEDYVHNLKAAAIQQGDMTGGALAETQAVRRLNTLRSTYVETVRDSKVGQRAYNAAIANGKGFLDALAAAERAHNRVQAAKAQRIPDLIELSRRQGTATRREKEELKSLLRQLKLTGTEITRKEEDELAAAIAAGKHKEAVKLLNAMLGRTPRHVQIKIDANVSAAMEDFRAVVDAALESGSAAAQGYSQAYKNALQMRSPSRVFIGIGKNVMAGLRIGLERNKPEWKNLMPKPRHFAEGKRGFQDFKGFIFRIWNMVRDKITGVWRPIRNAVSNGAKAIVKWWRDLGEDLRRITRRAWDFVRDSVSNGIKKVRDVVDNVMESLRDQWDRNWDGVRDIVSNVWDRIKDVISRAWDVVRRIFDNALDGIRRMWENGWGRLNDVLHRVWGNIFGFIRKIPGRILDFFKNLPENLRKVGENAIGAFAAGIKSGDSIIASAIKSALGPLTGGLSNIIDLFGDAGKATGDGLGDAAALSLGTGGGTAATWARKAAAAIPGYQGISGYRSPEENAAVGGATNSLHMDVNNPAQDISGSNLLAVAQWLVSRYGGSAREIIHTPLGFSVINGARVPPVAAADHYDHVHVADKGGVFKGPGMVQIGNLKELVFQPAEKMSDLPKRDETIAPLIKQLVRVLAFSRQDKRKEGPTAQGGVTARPAQGNVALFKNQNKVLNETNNVFQKQQREVLDSSKVTKDYSKVIKDTNDISVQQKEKIAVVIGGLRQLGGELQVSQRHTISNHLRTEDYKGGLELLHNAIDRVTGKSRDQAGILSKVEERFKQIRAKADSYRQTLNGIPRRKDTEADAKTRDATKKINDYLKKLEEVPGQISTTASVKMGQGTGLSLAKIAPGGKAGSAAAMAGAAMNAVRGTQVISSGYRPGDDGYHGDASNPAQDISGAQQNGVFIYGQSIYNYLIKTFGQNIREMIWAHDRWEDGQHNYWAAGDHFDHVHLADSGGVFRGPGLVRLGDTKETIFQPAEKMSELPNQETTNNKKMEVHFHGDHPKPADVVREIDWYARTRPW